MTLFPPFLFYCLSLDLHLHVVFSLCFHLVLPLSVNCLACSCQSGISRTNLIISLLEWNPTVSSPVCRVKCRVGPLFWQTVHSHLGSSYLPTLPQVFVQISLSQVLPGHHLNDHNPMLTCTFSLSLVFSPTLITFWHTVYFINFLMYWSFLQVGCTLHQGSLWYFVCVKCSTSYSFSSVTCPSPLQVLGDSCITPWTAVEGRVFLSMPPSISFFVQAILLALGSADVVSLPSDGVIRKLTITVGVIGWGVGVNDISVLPVSILSVDACGLLGIWLDSHLLIIKWFLCRVHRRCSSGTRGHSDKLAKSQHETGHSPVTWQPLLPLCAAPWGGNPPKQSSL